jgi:hypothetical protein
MQGRTMGLLAIALAGHTLELPPRLATGMTVRTDVAATRPAVITNGASLTSS